MHGSKNGNDVMTQILKSKKYWLFWLKIEVLVLLSESGIVPGKGYLEQMIDTNLNKRVDKVLLANM